MQDVSRILYYKNLGQEDLWLDCAEKLTAMIQNIIEFAKLIPGFMRLSQDDQVNLTTEEKQTKFFSFSHIFIWLFQFLIPLINSFFIFFFVSFSLPVSYINLFLFGNYFLLLSSHPSLFVDIAAENWFIRIGHCSNVSTDGSGAERCPVWRCIAPTRSLLHVRLFRNEIGCVHIWDCKKYCRTEANWNRVGIVSELSATLARWLVLLFFVRSN